LVKTEKKEHKEERRGWKGKILVKAEKGSIRRRERGRRKVEFGKN
jgi:hypothetical protein